MGVRFKIKLQQNIIFGFTSFAGSLQYFPKNRSILVHKLGEEKKLSKSVSSYFITIKKYYCHLARGGGMEARH